MIYRILLVYFFYTISRFLFFVYNYSFLEIDSIFEYVRLSYHGLAFDTTAIFYLNSLFVLFSMLTTCSKYAERHIRNFCIFHLLRYKLDRDGSSIL